MPGVLLIAAFIYRLLIKKSKKYIDFTPDVLFGFGMFSYLILIGVLQAFYGSSAIDIHIHDTYFVLSYSHILFFVSIAFAIFAAAYYWFVKVFKKTMNNTLGCLHFWISFLSTTFLLVLTQYIQFVGVPRRYYSYSNWHGYNAMAEQSIYIAILSFLLIIAQLVFVFNFLYSIFRKK